MEGAEHPRDISASIDDGSGQERKIAPFQGPRAVVVLPGYV
jgi:hypothetical protein